MQQGSRSRRGAGLPARLVSAGFALWLGLAGFATHASEVVVREERTIMVAGHRETWRLEWQGKPVKACGADAVYMANTCPCSGLAYGEAGQLWLVRRRGGRDIEHLDLTQLFGKFDGPGDVDGMATAQRWPMRDRDYDREANEDPKLIKDIEHRKPVRLMVFADYDHDGNATEFLLQVGTLPCGKLQLAAVGISAANPHLHVFGTGAHSNEPLMMSQWVWERLKQSGEPKEVEEWPCGDHGSEESDRVVVSAKRGQINATSRVYECRADGHLGKLTSQAAE